MSVNKKKIDKAILEIKKLQLKYASIDTMFVFHALDTALKVIGWSYAALLEEEVKNGKIQEDGKAIS